MGWKRSSFSLSLSPSLLANRRCPELSSLMECEPSLGNDRCTTPIRDQASRVGNEINAATRPRVWIAGKDKAVLFRQIGVVVAQIEVEDLVGEGHARLPIEIGR